LSLLSQSKTCPQKGFEGYNVGTDVAFCHLVSQLTAKQLQAVSGIAKGLPISQIAKSLDVSPRTVQRWEKLPQFATALGQVQHEVSCRIKAESVENATTITCRLENYSAKIS
jgi:FixJ family two-component response regulator